MQPLKIFISSVMRVSLEDLINERKAARDAICELEPIVCPWAFETEPASSKPLRDSYIDAVKQCDALVLILGKVLTEATRDECMTALEYRKPVLVFLKKTSERDPETQDLVNQLDRKYGPFESAEDLRAKVKSAVGQLVSETFRGEPINGGVGDIISKLRKLKGTDSRVAVWPLVPSGSSSAFVITDISADRIKMEKVSSGHTVEVPSSRIADVLPGDSDRLPKLLLDGRLQLITLPRKRWVFEPERPPDDGLGIGHSRVESTKGLRVTQIEEDAAKSGRSVSWARLDKLAHKLEGDVEVFYDYDGKYIRCLSPDSNLVLVIRPIRP